MPSSTAEDTGWPPVPDGARLSDLATRRAWLGRVEVAYALPTHGWLWWPATSGGVAVTCDGSRIGLVSMDDPEQARSVLMTSGTRHSVHEAWPGWWTATPSAGGGEPDAILALRWRGLVSIQMLRDAAATGIATYVFDIVRESILSSSDTAARRLARRLLESP